MEARLEDLKNVGRSAAGRGAANLVKMMTGRLLIAAVLTVSGFLLPRFMGPAAYGRYAAILAVVVIVQTASALGLQQVEIRFLAPLWQTGGTRQSTAIELGSSLWTARLVLAALAGSATVLWLGLSPLELSSGILLAAGLLSLLRAAQEATKGQLLPLGRVGRLVGLELLQVSLTLPVVLFFFAELGLNGVFVALPVLHTFLLLLAVVILLRQAPLRLGLFRWSKLAPHVSYSLASFSATLTGIVQQQFAVYALAAWAAERDAGLLAVALQMMTMTRGLFFTARRALMPILAQLEAAGEATRLKAWGGVMMRYSMGAASLGFVGWTLLGDELVRAVLRAEFAAVYPCAALLLGSVIFFCGAATCNGLLLIRGRAGWVAFNTAVHAVVVLAGMGLAIWHGGPQVAVHVAWAYLGGAIVSFLVCHATLGRFGDIYLPLRRPAGLSVPALLGWAATSWTATLPAKVVALAAFVAVYGTLAVRWKLLPAEEAREILRAIRYGLASTLSPDGATGSPRSSRAAGVEGAKGKDRSPLRGGEESSL